MAVSYIGSSSGINTATVPVGTQQGDLVVLFAFNRGSTTVPTLPTNLGWTSTLTASNVSTAINMVESSGQVQVTPLVHGLMLLV